MADLLFECFSEEIPARMQRGAAEQLESKLTDALKEARLNHGAVQGFVSPRHLSVVVKDLPEQQPDHKIERKGPKTNAPDKALEGFLRSTGLKKDQLEVRNTGKDDCYFAVIEEKGKPTHEAVKEILETIMKEFHWPKSQRWGDHAVHWVRPLQAMTCLLGERVIPVEFGHLKANDVTYGHRFMAPDQIVLTDPGAYLRKLEDAYVLVDQDQREGFIESKLMEVANKHGYKVVHDEALLEEVAGLVEWPVVLFGEFEESYLQLPPEVLISEMRYHQKYFALENEDGTLANHFLVVANMVNKDSGEAVVKGNGRVLKARLEDGQFYWNQDRNTSLSDWSKATAGMIFHAKLGTVRDKTGRIAALSPLLAVFVPHANLEKVERAGKLCKADLVTGMVGEFPDLQGVMGRYYALDQKEDAEVADAIRDHYKPLGAKDDAPTASVSITVALADKLDSLVGLFAIGEKPTGSKDPFALRRAALGVIRIIVDNNLRMPLKVIIDKALTQYPKSVFQTSPKEVAQQLLDFFADRLKVILKDEGIRHDYISAVFAGGDEDDLIKIVNKAKAISGFLGSEDGENLLAAYRRASNILAAEEKKDGRSFDSAPSESLFDQDEEKALFATLQAVAKPSADALSDERYADAMQELSALRAPVDAYFDKVMVNADDKDLRANRLCTLNLIRERMDGVVNFSLIEG